ncbi:MAG: amidinotransferase [Alteromonadaceae bacterium]|nr:amidinotransferase [Alteromonadaceae bacterium]
MFKQSSNVVLMVRPHSFSTNTASLIDNFFQSHRHIEKSALAKLAYQQTTQAIERLRSLGLIVHVFEDETERTPDSVFPNNWFSTHPDGTLVTYPMFVENRRLERREDILTFLKEHYHVTRSHDFASREIVGEFVEGTGSMVIDYSNKRVYAALSNRTTQTLLNEIAKTLGLSVTAFIANDPKGNPIYHSNVMMSVGTKLALVALNSIEKDQQRKDLIQQLSADGKTIVDLAHKQMNQFCGNALEVEANGKHFLVCSKTAYDAFTETQKSTIEQYCEIVPIDVSAIESAGGSIRCMMAAIHLPKR